MIKGTVITHKLPSPNGVQLREEEAGNSSNRGYDGKPGRYFMEFVEVHI